MEKFIKIHQSLEVMVVLINDIKVQDEKIVIITEDQILKALGLSNKKYELYDVESIYNNYPGKSKIIVKVKVKDTVNKSIHMNIIESKTLNEYMD